MDFRHIWGAVMTPADKILILSLLVLSLSSYLLIRSFFPLDIERIAVVEFKGKEVMRLSLNAALPPRQRHLNIDGGEAIFDLSDGKVRVLPMENKLCPNHICSRTGWIEKPWEMIVCVPNKITVRIFGEEKEEDVDLITR